MEEEQRQEVPIHQVMVDGKVIYCGPNWAQIFLEAARNPHYGFIVHVVDGKPQSCWWPVFGRASNPTER